MDRTPLKSMTTSIGSQAWADEQHRQAASHLQQGQADLASQLVERVLDVRPDHLPSMHLLGHVLAQQQRWQEAQPWLTKALTLDPENVAIDLDMATTMRGMGLYEQALAHYDRVLSRQPDWLVARYNRANTLRDLDRHKEAIADYRMVLQRNPRLPQGWSNLGNALRDTGQLQTAIDAYSAALAYAPDLAAARYNLSLCLLEQGQFTQAWPNFEARWQMPDFQASRLVANRPIWTPTGRGQSLLIWAEQGLGDEIFWSGLLHKAHEMSDRVRVRVDPRLVPLLQPSFPRLKWHANTEPVESIEHDTHLPMGSLGPYWREGLENFPSTISPYITADPERSAALKSSLCPNGERLCGIAWRSHNPRSGRHKSLDLQDFLPVLQMQGWRFVNLQYGNVQPDIDRLQAATGIKVATVKSLDITRDIVGLSDLVGACDVVVSCSNTTVHLAGAMGKPCLLLLGQGRAHIWYWGNRRNDRSLWYPSIKILQKSTLEEGWDVPMQAATAVLRNFPVND